MTSTPCSTSPVGVHAPYRVAPDTYVIPELVAGRWSLILEDARGEWRIVKEAL